MEACEMHRDHELLAELLNEAPHTPDGPLCVKLLSRWTGRAGQTISEYRNGQRTIPVEFWRQLLMHWRCPRIVDLLLGGCSYEIVFDADVPDLSSDVSAFKAALESMETFHETGAAIAQLFADGRVDEADASTIRRYNVAYFRHRWQSAQVHKAVNRLYDQALERSAT